MKTVIEMARDAGLHEARENPPYFGASVLTLERFAELVRADERKKWEDQTAVEINEAVLDEREACAKVCDYAVGDLISAESSRDSFEVAVHLRDAIRARGQA